MYHFDPYNVLLSIATNIPVLLCCATEHKFRVWVTILGHMSLHFINLLQRYKTDFSTSLGWYINIITVNEITVFKCKFKLKP